MLLLIDGGFGFEMETFEFLNLLQVHGFPKVMGVLTHLDGFRDTKALKKTKKALKHRFWTEIYQGRAGAGLGWGWGVLRARRSPRPVRWPWLSEVLGARSGEPTTASLSPLLPGAKLFYLSGLKNGKYLKREVHNLGEQRGGGWWRWRDERVVAGASNHCRPACKESGGSAVGARSNHGPPTRLQRGSSA